MQRDEHSRRARAAALIAPVVLIGTMLIVFRVFDRWLGFPLGYLCAFAIYWVACLSIPAWLLGGVRPLLRTFAPMPSFRRLGLRTHLFLWTPVLFPLVSRFVPFAGRAGVPVLAASVLLGAIIAVTEEALWRGVYLRMFPDSIALGVVYPSILFGLWHICPQSVRPPTNPGGVVSFVVYAIVLGVLYALAARRTRSITWPVIAHALHDTLGLGGLAYSMWLAR